MDREDWDKPLKERAEKTCVSLKECQRGPWVGNVQARVLAGDARDIIRELLEIIERAGPSGTAEHFVCPNCGPHVRVDEDGCHVSCGTACFHEPCKCELLRVRST